MTEKACRNCNFITEKSNCPACGGTSLSDDWSGYVVVPEPYLFSFPLELKQELQQKQVSEKLREIFKQHGYAFSEQAEVEPIDSKEWKILDGKKEYVIKEGNEQLNIYKQYLDPTDSEIAKRLNITQPGKYALRVR
ncbi:MAG: transcription elongation factor subunit Spt4 [Candidatus Hadarchaeaceae archaeon]